MSLTEGGQKKTPLKHLLRWTESLLRIIGNDMPSVAIGIET